jgi:hypothetical protein
MADRPARSTKPVLQKLGVKPGNSVLLVNPPEAVLKLLEPPAGASLQTNAIGHFDVVVAFVRNRAEIEAESVAAMGSTREGGYLWFAYPKRSAGVATDISRDTGWEPMREAGWDTVTLVAIDDTWAALRFRPVSDIPVMRRKAAG